MRTTANRGARCCNRCRRCSRRSRYGNSSPVVPGTDCRLGVVLGVVRWVDRIVRSSENSTRPARNPHRFGSCPLRKCLRSNLRTRRWLRCSCIRPRRCSHCQRGIGRENIDREGNVRSERLRRRDRRQHSRRRSNSGRCPPHPKGAVTSNTIPNKIAPGRIIRTDCQHWPCQCRGATRSRAKSRARLVDRDEG
jgi:hypothetical protein